MSRPRFLRFRVVRGLSLALSATLVAVVPATGGVQPAAADPTGAGGGGAGAPGSDSVLVLEIARLTDQIQTVEEKIAVDQVHQALDSLQLHQAEGIMRADAVDAYMSGGSAAHLSFLVPSPVTRYYRDIVVNDQRSVVADLRRAEDRANRDAALDQADYKLLSALNGQLDQERSFLEARAAADAQLAIEQQAAQARASAMQQQEANQQQLLNSSAANGGVVPVGTAVSATQTQQSFQGRYPFGPLSASQLGQYGLVETGQTISGVASWYGPGFDGRPTASGAIYDENGWTCASPNLPFGTILLVTAGSAGALVEVNDRGPYVAGRVLDLSHAAAQALGSTGLISVVAYVVAPS